jgi:fumarate reductase flavoprotein subunit
MEAIQFHPTAIFPAGILVTEGCRGDGGLLRDVDGKRFMPDYEPEKKELASRDVVARRMEEHIHGGKGVQSRYGEHLWLDITLLGAEHINRNLREVKEICGHFLGIDPTKDWIPVRPAQHYTMGGVRTNHTGESPTLRGLFAAGEAACWDMHGFNRLGGNSVAETVVGGMIVGEFIADFCDRHENHVQLSTGLIHDFLAREQAKLDALIDGNGKEEANTIRGQMQDLMTAKVGIFRTGEDLASAVEELHTLLLRSRNIGLRYRVRGANPELVSAYRVQKMLKLALCIAYGALRRTESRGAHFRQDFPRRDDAQWLARTLATWAGPDATLPSLAWEPLDVMQMELPPGWRGYGAKDYVDHADTARRAAEVAAIRAQHGDAGRHQVQEKLMPFDDLLPARFRGRNERIDEPLDAPPASTANARRG